MNLPDCAIALSSGFPYGFGDGGTICGAIAGATMVLGAIFGRTQLSDPLPKKCLDFTRELNDYIIKKHNTPYCPILIEDYEFATATRKEFCTNLVYDILDCFALIMEREHNITIIQ